MKIDNLKHLFVVALFCLLASVTNSSAQGLCEVIIFQLDQVKGKVVSDGPNGDEPIPNAKILLRKPKKDGKYNVLKTAYTDDEGKFDIDVSKIKGSKFNIIVSQEELRFVNFSFGVEILENALKKEENLYIRLGVEFMKPCGGGTAKLVEN